MMLSAFDLDERDGAVRSCLRNPYEMHRTVMSGFPDVADDAARRAQGVLYRVQADEKRIRLYVLCAVQPDWSRLSKGFAPVGAPKSLSEMISAFAPGNRYAFDLLANPCKKVARPGKNSNRVFLSDPAEREAWLRRKAEAMGAKILWMREDGQVRSAAQRGTNQPIDQTGVRFRGELCVTDAARFAEAFGEGIGPGKAFGFGLLMLFPPEGG